MTAVSVGVLGFSINGVDYLLNDVKSGHCLSFDFPQNMASTRTCMQEGYLECDLKKCEKVRERVHSQYFCCRKCVLTSAGPLRIV